MVYPIVEYLQRVKSMTMSDEDNKALMELQEKYNLIKLKQLALPSKTKYETSEELEIMEFAREL